MNPLEHFLVWVELDPNFKAHNSADHYEDYRKSAASAGVRFPFGRNHLKELLASAGKQDVASNTLH